MELEALLFCVYVSLTLGKGWRHCSYQDERQRIEDESHFVDCSGQRTDESLTIYHWDFGGMSASGPECVKT